jgi:hypothetical protein
MSDRYARCNRDGRPLSPGDQAAMDEFRDWLSLSRGDRNAIIASCIAWVSLPADERAKVPEPEWCTYLGFTALLERTTS